MTAVCQYKLIGGVLIFIPFRLGIDNDHFPHDIVVPVIGDTVLYGKNGLVKGELRKLGFGKLQLRLHSVKEYLHGFQIIVRANGFLRPQIGRAHV